MDPQGVLRDDKKFVRASATPPGRRCPLPQQVQWRNFRARLRGMKADNRSGPEAARVLSALRDDQQRWLRQLVELSVDELLGRRVDELVDTGLVLKTVETCLRRSVTAEVIERTLKPAAARERERARLSGERVKAWWPGPAAAELLRVLRLPFPLNPRSVESLVDQGAVRSMLGAVLQEAIVGFATRAKLPGLSRGAELAAALGRRAGKGLLGGVGKGIEKQVERAASEFVEQSMSRLTRKLAELLVSDAGLRLQGTLRAELMERAMQARVSYYYEELAKLPADDLWALLPPVIAHNLERPEILAALEGEVQAFLQREGPRPAGDLLADLGIARQVRDLAVRAALPQARRIVDTDAFATWLEQLLSVSDTPT
jgi:hypothetical protein